ncbi:MAG: DUF4338 domain-containing protein [Acidobacteria bacterium]|nr:DUF4338 domain-containing protein [Acidobacteriota bacterium]
MLVGQPLLRRTFSLQMHEALRQRIGTHDHLAGSRARNSTPIWLSSARLTEAAAVEFKYRGRDTSQEDILYVRALVERHPNESRRTLSTKLCEAWQWRQANGALRDMVCRGLPLMLERAGQITLPPVSYVRHNRLAKRIRPEPARIDTTPIEDRLRNFQPLEFEQVRRTSQEPLFNSLFEEHHYLGYEQPVGEHLKYLVWAQGRPVASLAWSSAPRHLGSRDCYIGWSGEARLRNIRFIAYNTRFLILPWERVEHLASHILGRMAARISDDWQRLYGHPVYFLETSSARRRAEASNPTATYRTGRSKKFWDIR